MKKLLILLFSLMLSFNSYGEWTKFSDSLFLNTTFYIDKDTIKESDGHVYFWELDDYSKPNPYGELSGKIRRQANCKENQYKTLSFISYKQNMGTGEGEEEAPSNYDEWIDTTSESILNKMINYACSHIDSSHGKIACVLTDGKIGTFGETYLRSTNLPFTGTDLCKYGNGQKQSEGSYKDGRQEGKSSAWWENGQKLMEGNFVNGKPDGIAKAWYEDGQKMMETNYILGKPEGKNTFWDENGEYEESYWEDGACISGGCPNKPKKSKSNTPVVTISIN